ncbi:MAG: hypothetical protein JKY08_05880 [Flavobacteriaceae bacterium]|nr:hypothetical protein [Flavobacteriaceae bacterium]
MINKIFLLIFVSMTIAMSAQEPLKVGDSYLKILGTSNMYDWKLEVDLNQIELEEITFQNKLLTSIELKIPVVSLNKPKYLGQKKINRALEAKEFPFLKVMMDECFIKNDSIYCDNALYTIGGVQRKLPFKSSYELVNNNYVLLSGEQKIAMDHFDVQPPTGMFGFMNTGNEVLVKFHFFFLLKNENIVKIK